MFDRVRNAWGALTGRAKPAPKVQVNLVRARYDNAISTDENARSWQMADYLSAKSANIYQVRRTLRMRSRYETANNPFLFGVTSSNADDLIGTGPNLKCQHKSSAVNKAIETAWNEWAAEVNLVEKLRTIKLAKTVDGEGFLVLKTAPSMLSPVQLYPVDLEADQVSSFTPDKLVNTWLDGVTLDWVTGQPVSYEVLRAHPGDFFFPAMNALASDTVKARHVIHWFQKFRPGQVRGIPVFTSALDLFAELRSFRKAVLTKANVSANLTAVLETEAPPGDDSDTAKPFVSLPIDRGTMTTLPAGNTLKQYDTGEPSTTYQMFQEKCLGEACRPLCYPLNLALGSSQNFNFSSARLDHLNYRNALDVERADCNRTVLDKLFAAWLDEAIMIPGLIPAGINTPLDIPRQWHWPGYVPLDPVADATADHSRINNGTMTFEQFWAARGHDWRDVMEQQDAEQDLQQQYGLIFGEPLRKTQRVDATGETSQEAAQSDS